MKHARSSTALYWICLNYPSGDDFFTWNAKFCKGTLIVDGIEVTRKKGKKNIYLLDDKEFHAIRSSVPEEISNLLNITRS